MAASLKRLKKVIRGKKLFYINKLDLVEYTTANSTCFAILTQTSFSLDGNVMTLYHTHLYSFLFSIQTNKSVYPLLPPTYEHVLHLTNPVWYILVCPTTFLEAVIWNFVQAVPHWIATKQFLSIIFIYWYFLLSSHCSVITAGKIQKYKIIDPTLLSEQVCETAIRLF